ncbi:hypothetical protein B0H14DRAFT_3424639 [Mycena olivaceomarginata]|nr:hypothetical protein B0H14DRAFT_3424639 [Mycena olivaceomarginata]
MKTARQRSADISKRRIRLLSVPAGLQTTTGTQTTVLPTQSDHVPTIPSAISEPSVTEFDVNIPTASEPAVTKLDIHIPTASELSVTEFDVNIPPASSTVDFADPAFNTDQDQVSMSSMSHGLPSVQSIAVPA